MATITRYPSSCIANSGWSNSEINYVIDNDQTSGGSPYNSTASAFFSFDFSQIPADATIVNVVTTIKYEVQGTISYRICKDATSTTSYTSLQSSPTTVYSNNTNSKVRTDSFNSPQDVIDNLNNDIGILRNNRFCIRLYENKYFGGDIYYIRIDIEYTSTSTISTNVSPSNSGTVSGGGTYTDGDSVTLTATPATGYKFSKWQKDGVDDGETSATRTITVSGDATYTAVFVLKTYKITTEVTPAGGGAVSGGGTYSYGSTATLTATPATGYRFVKWQKGGADDGNTSTTRTITVKAKATYTAVFALNSYNITKTLSHATLSNSSTTIQHGSSYSSTVIADTNYAIDTVTVTMGGTDITSTAYSNGSISIASVTGNISITVTTTLVQLPEISSVSIAPNPVNAGQGLVLTVVFT